MGRLIWGTKTYLSAQTLILLSVWSWLKTVQISKHMISLTVFLAVCSLCPCLSSRREAARPSGPTLTLISSLTAARKIMLLFHKLPVADSRSAWEVLSGLLSLWQQHEHKKLKKLYNFRSQPRAGTGRPETIFHFPAEEWTRYISGWKGFAHFFFLSKRFSCKATYKTRDKRDEERDETLCRRDVESLWRLSSDSHWLLYLLHLSSLLSPSVLWQ